LYEDKFGSRNSDNFAIGLINQLESWSKNGTDLKEFTQKLSELPLFDEPGTQWWYSHSFDLLGYLIEVLSGVTLDIYLKEQIFTKLGMNNTDFYISTQNKSKLVGTYQKNKDGKLVSYEHISPEKKPSFLSGGAGLFSTLSDYSKFCQMILDKGKYNGIQILSEESIEVMLSNHLPNGQRLNDLYPPDSEQYKIWRGSGFGLGGWVKLENNSLKCGIGTYGWMGALNAYFHVDPRNQIFSIFFPQRFPETGGKWALEWKEYFDLVYGGLKL
jgi:CubicO group peptidase (beta-lactamase class C family)